MHDVQDANEGKTTLAILSETHPSSCGDPCTYGQLGVEQGAGQEPRFRSGEDVDAGLGMVLN